MKSVRRRSHPGSPLGSRLQRNPRSRFVDGSIVLALSAREQGTMSLSVLFFSVDV
jgi:hypothetical protein